MSEARERWPSLVSDPEVFTSMLREMGMTESADFKEIWGLDDDMLGMVEGDALAMVMCYPADLVEKTERSGDSVPATDGVKFLWQNAEIGNACGTVACIHAALNNPELIGKEGPLADLSAKISTLNSNEKGVALGADEVLQRIHSKFCKTGPASTGTGTDKATHHFIAFIAHDGSIYELDGLLPAPVKHNSIAEAGSFLKAAAKVAAARMARNPEGHFQMMALTKNK